METAALGFQHYILALGTAVMIPTFLVPLMGGSDVSLSHVQVLLTCFLLFIILFDSLILMKFFDIGKSLTKEKHFLFSFYYFCFMYLIFVIC